MRTIFATMLLAAAAISQPCASAQQLVAGDMINLRRPASTMPVRQWGEPPPAPTWTEATVVRLANDTLWYRVGRNVAQVPAADAQVRRLTGRDYRWGTAIIVGVAGGAIGALVGYANFEPEYSFGGSGAGFGAIGAAMVCAGFSAPNDPCRHPPQSNSLAGDTAVAALFGAMTGGLLGYVVGKRLGNWESVDLTPSFADAGGLSLSLRVGF